MSVSVRSEGATEHTLGDLDIVLTKLDSESGWRGDTEGSTQAQR